MTHSENLSEAQLGVNACFFYLGISLLSVGHHTWGICHWFPLVTGWWLLKDHTAPRPWEDASVEIFVFSVGWYILGFTNSCSIATNDAFWLGPHNNTGLVLKSSCKVWDNSAKLGVNLASWFTIPSNHCNSVMLVGGDMSTVAAVCFDSLLVHTVFKKIHFASTKMAFIPVQHYSSLFFSLYDF